MSENKKYEISNIKNKKYDIINLMKGFEIMSDDETRIGIAIYLELYCYVIFYSFFNEGEYKKYNSWEDFKNNKGECKKYNSWEDFTNNVQYTKINEIKIIREEDFIIITF